MKNYHRKIWLLERYLIKILLIFIGIFSIQIFFSCNSNKSKEDNHQIEQDSSSSGIVMPDTNLKAVADDEKEEPKKETNTPPDADKVFKDVTKTDIKVDKTIPTIKINLDSIKPIKPIKEIPTEYGPPPADFKEITE